ncbi:hypothetical protein B0H19DRAFT_1255198 [Mycena capillaripes]|nr:hypothetical protein B0H19DRAFT_1255198 [Mycena capillaripes]
MAAPWTPTEPSEEPGIYRLRFRTGDHFDTNSAARIHVCGASLNIAPTKIVQPCCGPTFRLYRLVRPIRSSPMIFGRLRGAGQCLIWLTLRASDDGRNLRNRVDDPSTSAATPFLILATSADQREHCTSHVDPAPTVAVSSASACSRGLGYNPRASTCSRTRSGLSSRSRCGTCSRTCFPAPGPPSALPPATTPAPAPSPVLGHPPVVAAGSNSPPPSPAYGAAKEARLGPVAWARTCINGESAFVIKTVLPAARVVMRNYRTPGPRPKHHHRMLRDR